MILNYIENPEEGFKVHEISSEIATFFVAGTDTTGHVIAICSYYIWVHADVCHDKIMQEVNKYLDDPSAMTIEKVDQMEYLEAVINETLRIAAPTFRNFYRRAQADHMLDDLQIKKDTLVSFSYFPNNFSNYYHDQPFEF